VSRICSTLNPGAGVVTSRGDVHYVVTEYGVAYLHGKSIRERALALIHIAHPDFREQLMEEARHRNYVPPEQYVALGLGAPELEAMESTFTTPDGREIFVRPIRPTDEDMIRDLFYSYSEDTVIHRFFRYITSMPPRELQRLMKVDYEKDMILVGTTQRGEEGEMIVAVGRYHIDPATDAAEVAFSMRDDWQGQGIGTYLFNQLIEIARMRGVTKFVAEVMVDNTAMINLFHKCALDTVFSSMRDGTYHLEFTAPPVHLPATTP
jgi:RimJ/RimL family protein N-acetyltransferase